MAFLSNKIRNFGNWFRDLFSDDPLELTLEKEDEMIEKLVGSISRLNLDTPAILYLYMFLPVARIMSDLTFLPLAPMGEIVGINGYNYVAFFRKKANVRRLIKRLETTKLQKSKKRSWWG